MRTATLRARRIQDPAELTSALRLAVGHCPALSSRLCSARHGERQTQQTSFMPPS